MPDVVLEYKRVKGSLSTGSIYYRADEKLELDSSFEDFEFSHMLKNFADMLRRYPDAGAIWHRTDRPGLIPYRLEEGVVTLFREDPVAAIASMCPPQQAQSPSREIQRVREASPRIRMIAASVRAGYDTLADAFGGAVYAKMRARTNGVSYVECPCCGIWALIHQMTGDPKICTSICMNGRCQVFDKPLPFIAENDRWAGYPTSTLLATASRRFYLPRSWNNGRSWVSWLELNAKYTEYEKEKEAWSTAAQQG